MRISTNMIYDKGVNSLQSQWKDILHTQQQVSTGRRVLTPADDPIGSARALEISQSKGVNSQFMTNVGYAEDRLNLVESKLTSVGDSLQYIREKTVAAGNASYSNTELGYLATDLRAQFDNLLALANSQDGAGDYLFSGYRANDKPFTGTIAGVAYNGDHGTQTIQVSASRYMAVSFPGSEVFGATRAVDSSLLQASAGTANTGAATTSVAFNPAQVDVAANTGRRYDISYDGTNYSVVEYVPGNSSPTPVTASVSGSTLSFNGIDVTVAGTPATGDRFEVFVGSPDMFKNLGVLIDSMERPGSSGMAGGAVAFGLQSIDGAIDNVLTSRARIGSQLVEAESLTSMGSDLNLQYESTISDLLDVDYAEAISRLTQQQTYLQAAQQSFLKVSGLSLFNYI